MTPNGIEQWLAGEIGLDALSLGSQAVEDAVKKRLAACGLTEAAYRERVNTDQEERQALIDAITVPETWFFRDREPFVFLAHYVSTTWLRAHPADTLHVLSIPCSTGEEPYSIAITLQEAGLLPDRYQIDAVDISKASLQKAQEGAYGRNSFRGAALDGCERYFKTEDAMCVVRPEVRAGIRFAQGNIMSLDVIAAKLHYDIIFCRNLLIYQHEEARQHIIAILDWRLKAEGLLFVGHAEMMSLLTERYEPVRHSGAFAYLKVKTKPCKVAPGSVTAHSGGGHPGPLAAAEVTQDRTGVVTPQPSGYLTKWRDALRSSSGQARSHPTAAIVGPQLLSGVALAETDAEVIISPLLSSAARLEPVSRLDNIRALADHGQLDKAAALCQDLLQENPQLAEAHFMLGVIRAAAGQVQAAEECLNRSLYLDADFYDALIHLSLLKARRGDEAGAERLRRHAKRVRDHAKVTT